MQSPPPPSEMTIFTWNMRNVLKQIRIKFSDYLFFELWSILHSKFRESSKFFDHGNRPKMSNFVRPKWCAMFWYKCRTKFQIWSIFYSKFLFNWGHGWLCASTVWEPDSKTNNQLAGGFNPKAVGPAGLGALLLGNIIFFALILVNFFLHTFQMILNQKYWSEKNHLKCMQTFFDHFWRGVGGGDLCMYIYVFIYIYLYESTIPYP